MSSRAIQGRRNEIHMFGQNHKGRVGVQAMIKI